MTNPWEDLPPARETGRRDLGGGWDELPPAKGDRPWPVLFARGVKIGLQSAVANQAKQLELAGVDAARGWHEAALPDEQPEGFAGKAGAALGTAAGLAPEMLAAAGVSTLATGSPIPGIVLANAASGAAGAEEGDRLKGAVMGGTTGLVLGGVGRFVSAAPWAVRVLAGAGGGAAVSAGSDVAEGRPVDVENAAAQGIVFGGLGAAEPAFGAIGRGRRVWLDDMKARNRAAIGAPAEPPPGAEPGSQIQVSAPM